MYYCMSVCIRGLKLTEHCFKVIERVINKVFCDIVEVSDMQFGLMPGRGTSDAIFIVRQLQEKYLTKEKILYVAFIDLEQAFDRVPHEVLWWAMRWLLIPEWLIGTVQAMYAAWARSRVRVNNSFRTVFKVQVGVHQGSVLSPLLVTIVLEVLSRGFRTGCPWELLYANNLVIISESLGGVLEKLWVWRLGLSQRA